MPRQYRLSQAGETFFAVEDHGEVRRAIVAGPTIFDGYTTGTLLDGGLAAATVLAPVEPTKLVCVGLNYRDHAAEMKKTIPPEPLLFFKPPSAVLRTAAPIVVPPGIGTIHYESELAVVIGRRAHRVPRARAWDYIFGVTCLNDVTARDIQNRETQYTRAKGFDTFAPLGPCIDVGGTRGPRTVEGFVNGERRQHSSTSNLIFSIEFLVEYITFVMTLEPGDVISTGTPSGVGPIVAGDVVAVRIEGVGELSNPVSAADDSAEATSSEF
jgi:2-keto-4-pentenoate hydratase/2-oxohepta-3-ene-1,7-dioic acid hydratase in catechol pathway